MRARILTLTIVALLSGCASRQVEGWYDASLQADLANYESFLASTDVEPKDRGTAARQTLGALGRAKYQIDYLAANVGEFERSELDWLRMTDDLLSAYGTVARLSSLPTDRLADGAADPEIAAGLEDLRRVVGRWGGAPLPTKGSRRITP